MMREKMLRERNNTCLRRSPHFLSLRDLRTTWRLLQEDAQIMGATGAAASFDDGQTLLHGQTKFQESRQNVPAVRPTALRALTRLRSRNPLLPYTRLHTYCSKRKAETEAVERPLEAPTGIADGRRDPGYHTIGERLWTSQIGNGNDSIIVTKSMDSAESLRRVTRTYGKAKNMRASGSRNGTGGSRAGSSKATSVSNSAKDTLGPETVKLLSQKQTELNQTIDRYDHLVSELGLLRAGFLQHHLFQQVCEKYHMENWTQMLDYDPYEAKKDPTRAFQEVRSLRSRSFALYLMVKTVQRGLQSFTKRRA